MMRRIASILLILILLITENASILVNPGETLEQPAAVELDTIIREIELGVPPEGPLSDREFLMPEGVSIDDVKNLWRIAAPFVSHGADDDDIRNAFASLGETIRLPDAVRIGNDSFPIRYDKAYVERNGFGQVLIHIPIDVPLFQTLPAWLHVYSWAIGGKQRLVYNVTETRWYRVRRRIEGLYNITYLDLETGETSSVLSSLSLGVYPEFGIAGEPPQPSFPPGLLKYFPGYANLTTIPPGTMIDFSRATPSFLVAVPGHYEDIDVLIPEHEEKFRVLFPAYDPVWLTGWLVETSLSSSNVEAGDILEVSYTATPLYIDPDEQPLNVTLTLLCPEGFEPLDGVQRKLNNTHTSGSFKLKAISPGTFLLTLKLDGNAFLPGWPPTDEVTYIVNVVGPESPKVEISLEEGTPFFKHVNLTVRLENKGAGGALNTVLEFSGDVEPLRIDVGSIAAGESLVRIVTLRLRSEVASIKASAIFFDASGNKYVSEGFATVFSPAYVVPEHFEEYTLRVPEHFEKRRVFIPGYEGYTHVKIYHPYSAFEIPGSFTIGFEGIILEAEGVKVYTSFLPIADEGFELRVIPKNLTLNIYGDVLVGPLIPVQGLQTTVPVKYVVTSVEPAFEEKLVREDEAKSILNATGCGEVKAPEGYEVTLASKRVVRKPLWVDTSTYWRLQQEGFGRIREGCYWYEDGHREEWPSADAVCEATSLEREFYANRIVLVYHPLQETPLESSLVRGLWLRNYATQDIDYTVTIEPVTLPPGKPETATLRVEKACCRELSMLLFTNTTFWVRLRKDERLVAELFMPRVLSLPFPFSLQWWRGFALGLINRSQRIMVNIMMLSMVAMVPRELMPVIAVALGFMKVCQVYNQRGEIFNATMALGNLMSMGLIYRGMADGYRLQNKNGFAAVCNNLSQTFLEKAREVASDLGLRLILDVSLEDFKVALGFRRASEFEQGYAAGRIVGAMVEAASYAATYATIYHEFSTARDTLNAAGQAGQLSASTVLKRFGQGLYAWITPAIWDLAETGIKLGVWVKGKLSLPDVSKLILADRFSNEFGETVGKAFRSLPDGGEPEDIAKGVSNIVDKATLDSDVPESVGSRILDILSRISREYVGEKDWGEKSRHILETMVEAWKRVSELEAWKKGGEPGKLLMDWMDGTSNGKGGEMVNVLRGLAQLGDGELESVGRALTRVGDDSENGLMLFKTYLGARDDYGREIADAFLNSVSKHPELLSFWSGAVEDRAAIFIGASHEQDRISLPEGIRESVYRVIIQDSEGENILIDGFRRIGSGQETIRFSSEDTAGRIRKGEEYLVILKTATPGDFLEKYPSRFVKATGGNAYLMDTEKSRVVEGLVGELDEYGGFAFIRFMVTDADGKQVELRLTQGGRLMLISGEGRTMIGGVELKTVWDDAGGEVARLLFLQEEGLDRYGGIIVLNRRLPLRPVLFLGNEEHIIEIELGQKYLDVSGMLKRIIGGEEYSRLSGEMSSGDAVLGVAYLKQDGGVDSAWTRSADAEFKIKEAEDVLGLIIVRKNGLSAVSLDESVRAELSGESLKFHGVKGMSGGAAFRVSEARFRELSGYGPILEITLPSGEAILFRVDVGGDGKTVYSKLALAVERYAPEINPVEYYGELKFKLSEGGQSFEYTLRDLMVVEYEDSRGIHRSVVGLSEPLPDKVLKEPQHVAAKLFTKSFLEKQGYNILEEEKHLEWWDEDVFFDFHVETPDMKIAIVECKHGDETVSKIKQADKYFEIARGKGWKLIYSFLHAPQTPQAEELLNHLVELMRQYPGTVEVFISGDKYGG